MARGWESKSIEDQQSEVRDAKSAVNRKARSPEEIGQQKIIDTLRLSRSRIVQQLAATQNPTYRKTLEAALADLDQKLSAQNGPKV
jgi:hypothetical protein